VILLVLFLFNLQCHFFIKWWDCCWFMQ